MPLGTPLGPPPVTIHHSPRRKAHPSGVQPPTQSNLSRSTITGSTDQLQYQSGSGYPSDRGSPFHNETHYYLPSGATHVIRSNPAGILPEGASSNQNQNGAINNNSKYKSNVLQQIARSLEPHAIERPSDRERPASGSSASSSSGYGHLPLAPLMHHSVEQPTYPYHLSNYGLASSYGMGQSNAHAKRYQSTPHCDLANNNTPEAQTISKQIRQLIDNGCDKDALDLVKETLMQDSFKSSAQSSHGQLGSSTNIQSKSGSNSCLVDRMQQPYMPHKLRKPPVPSYTSLESESGLYSGATSEKSASSVRSDSPVVSSGQLVSSREQLRVATKGDHRYHTSMVSYQHSSTLDSNANMPYPQSTSYASHYAYSNSSSASSLAASSSSSLSGQYHRFPSQATPSPPNVFSNASQSTPGQFGNSTKHLSGGKMHMSSQAGSTSTRNPYHRMMSPTRSALHPPNPSSQSGMHSDTVSHSSSGFRPTDPLPPPPLPHRTTSTVAPPPPPPLHSQFISSQDASSRIPSSTNSTSGTPQQTDSLTPGKHFMKSQLASTHYVAGRSSSSNYASSASSSSPQRVTSPTHGEDFKGISFNSRYSAAPATVLSSNSGNTSSPSASLCSNSSNALVSQVSQKLHNLSLASSAQSAPSNSLHSSYTSLGFMPTSPTQSYAASSSSGLQSPTPTMSSSSDYTPVSMLPPKRQMPPTSQSTGLQQSSSASHLQNLHHIQSPNSSSSSMHSINTQSSSSLNTANLKPYNSVGVSKQVSLQAWSARQAISQSPIIMKSVKSQQVQKPVLQTAVAPTIPPINIKTTVSTSTSVASSVRLSAPSGIAIQPTAPLSLNSIMSTEALSETSTSQLSPNSTSSKSNSRGVKNPPPYPALQSSAVSPTPSSSSSAQGGLGGELSHPPPSYTSLLQHTASRANISSASNYYRVSKVNTASKNNSPATVSSEESKPGSPLALPPPPYGVTLSMSQNDSIAQIISGLSSPTPSNSSNQSQVVVPTTDPPSYASSMAALAAQRAVVVLPTGSPTTHSESGSLVDRNSSISPSELLHVTKSTKGTVMTASDASTCQLQEPSVISPHSNCDLVNTVESICTSQVSALQAGITCGPPRAPESTGPPLPPKPSGNGSAPGPPPPPPHTHFLQHAHIVSDEVSQSSDSVIDYDLESVSDYQTYLAVPSLDGETGNVRNFHESQSSSMSVITNANVCKSPTLQEDETDMDGSQDLFEETPDGIKKRTHHSPIPTRRSLSRAKEKERRDFKLRNYSPAAFKFYMEQHVENLIKSQQQRERRREQLESEMMRAGLSKDDQAEMRRMLHQKESNYIRLRRAKMDKSMFEKLRTIGVGAFGEVALVRKIDANLLYAMKTLRKSDVLKRNQVAHVKAERDILAEADNEWVVKLYYSFQDEEHLYFVMDYIPGGDLMSLLIKFGIFEEKLAKFYIAELVLAVESVHKMGFIHRDIKPDNVLIDKEGHIKLTDFGLCTGFRWTHNSKYYHERADSMDFEEAWSIGPSNCSCQPCMNPCKTLERRKRREHQRCLAHSLVGTPNYIAPEVLKRTGYTQLCDWWSVGVILYEMVVGQPPFFANTPEETQQKVINWEKTLRIPSEAKLSTEVTDFILRLCCGAENRLGRNGADEIKSHAFFKSINFNENLREKQAPYLPTIQHPLDTSNFDSYDEENMGNSYAVDLNRANGTKNSKHPEHAFFEFTFRRFFDSCEPIRITNEDSTDSNLSEPSDLYEEVARSMPHASSPPNVLRSVGSPCSSPGGGNPQGSVTTLTPTGSNHSPAESVKEGGDAQNAVYV